MKKWLKRIANIAAPVGAFLLTGNPLITGVAGAATKAVTGGKGKDILKAGLRAGAIGAGANFITGAPLMGDKNAGIPGLVRGMLGMKEKAPDQASSAAKMLPAAATAAQMLPHEEERKPDKFQDALKEGASGLIAELLKPSNLLQAAGIGLSMYGAKKQDKDSEKFHDKEEKRFNEWQRFNIDKWNEDRSHKLDKDYEPYKYSISRSKRAIGGEVDNLCNTLKKKDQRSALADGGAVGIPLEGDTRGQDDKIKSGHANKTRVGDWIHSADIVAACGGFNTDAGQLALGKMEKRMMRDNLFRKFYAASKKDRRPIVKTALSDGERITKGNWVTALGKGNNERGANIMRHFATSIRSHVKNHDPDDIPNQVKDPFVFLKQAMQAVA